jgi:hypothetical protein
MFLFLSHAGLVSTVRWARISLNVVKKAPMDVIKNTPKIRTVQVWGTLVSRTNVKWVFPLISARPTLKHMTSWHSLNHTRIGMETSTIRVTIRFQIISRFWELRKLDTVRRTSVIKLLIDKSRSVRTQNPTTHIAELDVPHLY